jgi:ubiquinone/menaquinone biosynthesis C-methylase UbiE
VSVFADIPAGSTVLDLGCGDGTDSLIAAAKTGPDGRVYGVDFSQAMLSHSRAGDTELGAINAEFREATGQGIPFDDDTFDVAKEVFRVLKPGGRLYLADIVVHKQVPDGAKEDVDLWTA